MFEPPKEIYVLGAGGHGKVAIAAAQACNVRVAAVFDDDPAKVHSKLRGVRVVGPVVSIKCWPALPTLIAVGDNARRVALAAALDLSWATIVHPTAWVDETVRLGAGVLVLANAVVQADAAVGDHAIINNNATVEHDCEVAAGAHVASGACLAGGAAVGTGSLVGAGATLLPGAEVGDHAVVGAGAVVVNRVPDRTTAVGVPAVVVHSAAGARKVRRLRNGISHQL